MDELPVRIQAVTTTPEQPVPERKPLRMVECGACKVKVFIPGDLQPFESVPCTRCGHPVCMPLRLRQFELRSIIGLGGMATVYRAFDLTLHRMVAVKMLKKEMLNEQDVVSGFYREARAVAALNHTNIIHIYTFDEIEGQLYLVMELADHDSLDKWIERDGHLPELAVLDIGIKVASALDTALKHNLLHRDIKPANILFNDDTEPKLVDFGLARVADEEQAEYESTIWGTPYYVAPEKIRREIEDFQSDMYSLGGTLYHALTGRVPFDAPTVDELIRLHVNAPLVPPIEVLPEVTQATSDALAQTMAKKPAERFRTYDELIMALTASRSQLLVKQIQPMEESPEETPAEAQPSPEGGKSGWWRR
jgi:eukaryotic-like serine/threonine-protein kinase